jgi:hypothetical protein
LLYASVYGYVEVVEWLLKNGANIDYQDTDVSINRVILTIRMGFVTRRLTVFYSLRVNVFVTYCVMLANNFRRWYSWYVSKTPVV